MTTILFWNTAGNDVTQEVGHAAHEHDVDIIILAESQVNLPELLQSLNPADGSAIATYRLPGINLSQRLTFIIRYAQDAFDPLGDYGGISLWRLRLPVGRELLLVAVHLPSKLHRSDHEQTILATELGRLIREKEVEIGHSNTVLIGDFNMSPFENGIVAAHGIHAVSDRKVALRKARSVDGHEFPFFYNPMWNHMGDDARPPGTYFYQSGEVSHFWHTFDQALIRPHLLEALPPGNPRILTQVGTKDLIKNDRVDRSISDHLPIVLTLNVERLSHE